MDVFIIKYIAVASLVMILSLFLFSVYQEISLKNTCTMILCYLTILCYLALVYICMFFADKSFC